MAETDPFNYYTPNGIMKQYGVSELEQLARMQAGGVPTTGMLTST